jgi:Family of unknown function (DUF5995)
MVHELAELVSGTPKDVPAVIETLAAVREAAETIVPRGAEDGIASFSRLYHEITCGVLEGVEQGTFEAGTFIIDLDVNFACRYLAALRDLSEGREAPLCWATLFDVRSDPEIPTLNYAMAGVNAHVNFDLAFALLATWETHPDPAERDAQHRDYCRINDIFYAKMNKLSDEFHSPFAQFGDGTWLDRLGNVFGDLLVRETRDFAWDAAMRMWAHRNDPDWNEYRALEEHRTDHKAAILARGIMATRF